MSSLKEADIVRAILRYLKTVPNCFCWKEHGGMYGTAGIPDVIACIGGRFFAFEVKTEKGKATALQESVLRKIQKCEEPIPAKQLLCRNRFFAKYKNAAETLPSSVLWRR